MKKLFLFVLAGIFGFAAVTGCVPEKESQTEEKTAVSKPPKTVFVTIGTGGVTGVYYPTGGAIARMVNQKRDQHGIRVKVETSAGSVFNVNAIMAGALEFGLVQSDRQYQAVNGLAEWKQKGRQTDLRAVFSVHPECLTLVAAVDAGIAKMADLKGKRVNIGNPGSSHRQNAIDALSAAGIDYKTDLMAESVHAAEAPAWLQEGRIDAFFYMTGHPSGAIKEACAGARKVRFVPVAGPGIGKLIADNPYYTRATVPAGLYPKVENDSNVETFGVRATFVTSVRVDDALVYTITREIFENFEHFKKLHSAYAMLTKAGMLEGQSAEIHSGAMKYFKEAGLK